MVGIAKSVRDSSFLKNSLALVFGTVSTQTVVFLFSPLISRVFTPAEFGHLANYNAWVSILALLSSLRYEHAIIVAKGPDDTSRVFALTLALSAMSFLAYAFIAWVVLLVPASDGYLGDLRRIVVFIPFGVLLVCVVSPLIQLSVKTGNFRRLSITAVAQVLAALVLQIVLGLLHVQNALIIGTIIGYVVAGVMLAGFLLRGHRIARVSWKPSLGELRKTFREYRNFPRYTLPADMINVVVQQFSPVFVLALFNPVVAGLYAFALRVARVPLIVVATAVAGALRKEAVDVANSGRSLRFLFSTTVRTLLLLGFIPFLVMLFLGVKLFSVVFGPQWIEAGRWVQILSPGIFLEFVAVPLSVFFLVTNTQYYTFGLQVASFGSLVAALLVGKSYLNDFAATSYLVSATMVIVNLSTIAVVARITGERAVRRGLVTN